ncbi:MAG: hypothetical protein WBI18_00065 [Candidatus Saccharicenans sp.]
MEELRCFDGIKGLGLKTRVGVIVYFITASGKIFGKLKLLPAYVQPLSRAINTATSISEGLF